MGVGISHTRVYIRLPISKGDATGWDRGPPSGGFPPPTLNTLKCIYIIICDDYDDDIRFIKH